MREHGLTPDIPLGPFEGTPITAYATKGKAARLHAKRDCSSLRGDQVRTLVVPLNSETIERMCSHCAQWGVWARRGTALGIFLDAFWGYGLTEELRRHAEPDADEDVSDEEVAEAAGLLRSRERPSRDEDDEAEWEAHRAAEELRDSLAPRWCAAVSSLIGAAGVVARYPWLKPWASGPMELKIQHAAALRKQAAQLVNADALVAATVADRMEQPALPSGDPAFAVLGDTSEVRNALFGMWQQWRSHIAHGWNPPHTPSLLAYQLEEHLGNKRKGREQLRTRTREILGDWANHVQERAAGRQQDPDRLVIVELPAENTPYGHEKRFDKHLTRWDLGVLIAFTVDADWARRKVLLRVPSVIADRLLTGYPSLACTECPGDPSDEAAFADALATHASDSPGDTTQGVLLPGILDDTPVADRRPVTHEEIHTLRDVLDDQHQLFVVFSVSHGFEVTSLAQVEKRCEGGWSGVLLAEAGDLPWSLIEPWHDTVRTAAAEHGSGNPDSPWVSQRRTPDHPDFGEQFGTAAGVRELLHHFSHRNDDRAQERSLRILAMVRGVHDLRQLDDDPDAGKSAVPWAVWKALLATTPLNLRPFRSARLDSDQHTEAQLPLGILADVQIYTTQADSMIEGKGHSPFCRHAGDRRVNHGDYLLTVADLVKRTDLEWCSKCGGYAVRRLTDDQVAYYRAAHRLYDIDQQLTRELSGQKWRGADLSERTASIDEIEESLCHAEEQWQIGDWWRLQDVVRELKNKAQRLGRDRQEAREITTDL